ncbi:MAG: 50S ribosomal protein L4 [Clostridiales bacterium]|nr:50S ribosomal protein L4 [Clostridiales bacterium]
MPNVNLYDTTGQVVGSIELADAIFGQEVNKPVLHQVVVAHLAARRQGTQSAKTRAEISGGGKKPWRQKGTGHARQGSTRSPQWRHGGVVFAPKPRDYTMKVNKKMRRIALHSALSAKAEAAEIIVFDELTIPEAKTREMVKVLSAVSAQNALIVLTEAGSDIERAARNIKGIKTTLVTTLNTYEILHHGKLILTKDSAAKIEEVYA